MLSYCISHVTLATVSHTCLFLSQLSAMMFNITSDNKTVLLPSIVKSRCKLVLVSDYMEMSWCQ